MLYNVCLLFKDHVRLVNIIPKNLENIDDIQDSIFWLFAKVICALVGFELITFSETYVESCLFFSLGRTTPTGNPYQNQSSKEFEGEAYVCPPELILPPDVILPEFDRQAAIIERTAIFIARNNAQMEIVLKTKQSNNPQFKFLNYDDKLNPFYKELVKLIKSGRYIPRHRPNTSDSSKTDSDSNRNDVISRLKALPIYLRFCNFFIECSVCF